MKPYTQDISNNGKKTIAQRFLELAKKVAPWAPLVELNNAGAHYPVRNDKSPVPFFRAFVIGFYKVLSVLTFFFFSVQILYAIGWGLLHLLCRDEATKTLPVTGWVVASDRDAICILGGILALVFVAFFLYCAGTVATFGGWRWPTPLLQKGRS